MARIKYYYDTETCKYERIKVTKWDIFLNTLGFLTVSLIMGIGLLFLYTSYFELPQLSRLRKENQELLAYYEILEKEMNEANKMLTALQERDDNVYRIIFEAEPIPYSIRSAGVGGVEKYKDIINSRPEREGLIVNTFQEVDQLKKKMYIQTKSYDEILDLARNKSLMMAAIPSIQPIPNKDLKRLASGYGMRMHPILKIKRMHYGIDFSAPRGTPIYATGDGKVRTVRTSVGGFGKMVEIDHGYGYLSRYAHMNKFNVKRGQTVKRGDLIGYVGNTGLSAAPHLHYEIFKDGEHVNPAYYFFNDVTETEYDILLELASKENQSLGGEF